MHTYRLELKKKKTFWIILILEIVRGKSALSSQRTTSQAISSKEPESPLIAPV
jgi:hypothetical protein